MSIEIEVVALTRATELLLQAVNTRKVDLLAAVEGSLSSSQAAQAALVRVTEQTGISATNADLTAANAAATAADKTQTALDRLASLDSLTQTNLSKQAAELNAQAASEQAGIATTAAQQAEYWAEKSELAAIGGENAVAIAALQTQIGTTGSTDPESITYRINTVETMADPLAYYMLSKG